MRLVAFFVVILLFSPAQPLHESVKTELQSSERSFFFEPEFIAMIEASVDVPVEVPYQEIDE